MNYKEAELVGTAWTRCHTVHIINKYKQNPTVIFGEEQVVELGSSTPPIITNKGSEILAEFDPVNGSIPLVNPETGESLGTSISHVELYTILYSLYIQKALDRDAYISSIPIV